MRIGYHGKRAAGKDSSNAAANGVRSCMQGGGIDGGSFIKGGEARFVSDKHALSFGAAKSLSKHQGGVIVGWTFEPSVCAVLQKKLQQITGLMGLHGDRRVNQRSGALMVDRVDVCPGLEKGCCARNMVCFASERQWGAQLAVEGVGKGSGIKEDAERGLVSGRDSRMEKRGLVIFPMGIDVQPALDQGNNGGGCGNDGNMAEMFEALASVDQGERAFKVGKGQGALGQGFRIVRGVQRAHPTGDQGANGLKVAKSGGLKKRR